MKLENKLNDHWETSVELLECSHFIENSSGLLISIGVTSDS